MSLQDNINNRGILVGAPTVGVVLKMCVNDVAFEELVKNFEPLIKKQIKQLKNYNLYDELYQVGLIALWEAKINFDETKGRFPSYAKKYVYGKLLNFLSSESKIQQQYQTCSNPKVIESIPAPIEKTAATFPLDTVLPLLSSSEQIWLTEFYQAGTGPKAIADKYGVSTNTVKTWRKRTILKLQTVLTRSEIVDLIAF